MDPGSDATHSSMPRLVTVTKQDVEWEASMHEMRAARARQALEDRSDDEIHNPFPTPSQPCTTFSEDSDDEFTVHYRCEGRWCRFCGGDAATSGDWTTSGTCPSCYNTDCGGLHCGCRDDDYLALTAPTDTAPMTPEEYMAWTATLDPTPMIQASPIATATVLPEGSSLVHAGNHTWLWPKDDLEPQSAAAATQANMPIGQSKGQVKED